MVREMLKRQKNNRLPAKLAIIELHQSSIEVF